MKRTNFEMMLATNRDKDLFSTNDDFYAFYDFLKFKGLSYEEVINEPTTFNSAIWCYGDYSTLSDVVEMFQECVSYHDRLGRTAETYARARWLDSAFNVDNESELTDDEKTELDTLVCDSVSCKFSDSYIAEYGNYIFDVGIC